jgi:4-hydroxy-tetrahydrodipicolinate synthase
MTSSLKGVFPVLPTPFTAADIIDLEGLDRLVSFALEAGADGIVYPGMASEVETLSAQERATAVARVGAAIGGRVPFIVGASHADPSQAAAHCERGRAAGAVAAMIMAPNRLGADIEAQAAFYRAVSAETQVVIMLQNAPAPMGAGLEPAAVAAVVAACPAIRFVKEETLPSGQHVSAIRAAAGDRLDGVFGGAGARYVIDELERGASGTMPAAELADVHVTMLRAWSGGDKREARRLYSRTLPLLLFQQVFRVRMTKHVLAARGLVANAAARAAGPRHDEHDVRELDAMIAEAADLFAIHPVPRA